MSQFKSDRTSTFSGNRSEGHAVSQSGHHRVTPGEREMLSYQRPLEIAVGGLTAVGVAWAAAYVSKLDVHRSVGIAAWVAVAVVGTAASIAASKKT